jgi:DNA primase
LKQQIPLLDYLQTLDWQPARHLSRGRLMGLCPLHSDHKPSFLVDPRKSLFYCYGCGRGGDVIRFVELYRQVKFLQALTLLHQWRGLAPVLHEAAGFYRMQLHRHGEAVAYLRQRGVRSPELVEHMRIGYAPGGCLRGWLTQLGYPLQALRQAGLVTSVGYDAYAHRVVFPLEGNLYGRSISVSAPPHRFLPGAKGRLVFLGAGPAISRSDSGRGAVRLRRIVAVRFSQRHMLVGKSSQRIPVSSTERPHPDRLSGF